MIFVDAHVHIYDCFDLEFFFDSAFANLQSEAARRGQRDDFTAILLLTETSKDSWFERLKVYANDKPEDANKIFGDWKFHPTDEKSSLRVTRNKQESLLLIAGRQIVSAENLEVLALLTTDRFPDGTPVLALIKGVKESGGIPVIPWGFGKWMGQRGKIVRTILKLGEFQDLFLGDTSNRPGFLPRPSHFPIGEEAGVRKLPGTDPLPLATEGRRGGSFGFSIDGSLSSEHPATELKQILMDPTTHLEPFGLPERPLRFFRNQLAMQIKKRLHRSEAKMS